jgi:DNA-binding CsgD family transcriptional regulator
VASLEISWQIGSGNALRIIGNRLAPVNHEARTAMTAAIAGAIADEAAMATPGIALALPGRDGSGLVATILPLGRGERCGISGSFATAAAVFVQDPSLAPVYPGRAFAKLYGLTEAELRVLLAIAPGLGVKEVAAMLGIGEVTARTHLQHIFAKTGTSKQAGLLAVSQQLMSCKSLGDMQQVCSQYIRTAFEHYREQSERAVQRGKSTTDGVTRTLELGARQSARGVQH